MRGRTHIPNGTPFDILDIRFVILCCRPELRTHDDYAEARLRLCLAELSPTPTTTPRETGTRAPQP